jgi:hypothetical protein
LREQGRRGGGRRRAGGRPGGLGVIAIFAGIGVQPVVDRSRRLQLVRAVVDDGCGNPEGFQRGEHRRHQAEQDGVGYETRRRIVDRGDEICMSWV